MNIYNPIKNKRRAILENILETSDNNLENLIQSFIKNQIKGNLLLQVNGEILTKEKMENDKKKCPT